MLMQTKHMLYVLKSQVKNSRLPIRVICTMAFHWFEYDMISWISFHYDKFVNYPNAWLLLQVCLPLDTASVPLNFRRLICEQKSTLLGLVTDTPRMKPWEHGLLSHQCPAHVNSVLSPLKQKLPLWDNIGLHYPYYQKFSIFSYLNQTDCLSLLQSFP